MNKKIINLHHGNVQKNSQFKKGTGLDLQETGGEMDTDSQFSPTFQSFAKKEQLKSTNLYRISIHESKVNTKTKIYTGTQILVLHNDH